MSWRLLHSGHEVANYGISLVEGWSGCLCCGSLKERDESWDPQPGGTTLCPIKICMQSLKVVTHGIDIAGAWCTVQRHALRDTVLPLHTARRLRMRRLWQ